MAIYISKNAISSIPITNSSVNTEEQIPPGLSSVLLSEDDYLEELRRNDVEIKPLGKDNTASTYESVRKLKMALNIIDQYEEISGNDFSIPKPIDTSNGIYDQQMEDAVTLFQEAFEIQTDNVGKIDAITLDKIDTYIDPNVIYETNDYEIIGKAHDKLIKIISSNKDAEDNYLFKVEKNGESFELRTKDGIYIKPIYDNSGNLCEQVITDNHEVLKKVREKLSPESIIKNPTLFIKGNDNTPPVIDKKNNELNKETLEEELGGKPISPLPPELAKEYLVKEGDQLVSIIKDSYYNKTSVIKNPFDGNDTTFYSFPERTLSDNIETREYDARLQFYINIIYYYNSQTDKDGNILDYGIKKTGSYQRHTQEHLNDFYMFDNKFDSENPSSALPNYYRFLNQQKENGTHIEFDSEGNATSFEMVKDKYIWIPTREFADALYYHLNFRHDELLKITDDVIEYITETDFQDLLLRYANIAWEAILSLVDSVIDFVRDETVTLLRETLTFFKEAYNFAVDIVANYYPRGLGVALGANIGVTWIYPVATDISLRTSFWRKMSPIEELTFVMRSKVEAFVGADTGTGADIGFSWGSGKKKKNLGFQLGAGARSGIKPSITMETELPIRREETGILTALITVFGVDYTNETKTAQKMSSVLSTINLEPLHYLTLLKFSYAYETEAWAAAAVGYNSQGEPDPDNNINQKKIDTPREIPVEKDKSFLDADSIWNNSLAGMGVSGTNTFNFGIEIEYKAKYDKNPLVPEVNGRVVSEVEIQSQFMISNQLNIDAMGNLLQKALMSFAVGPFKTFLSILNQGFAFGVNAKYTREAPAKEIELEDVKFSQYDASTGDIDDSALGITQEENKLSFGTDKGKWVTTVFLSKFQGDVTGQFMLGSETQLKLDLFKIRELLKSTDSATSFFSFKTVDNLLDIVYSIDVQKKIGIGYNGRATRKFVNGIEPSVNKMIKGSKVDFVGSRKQKGLDIFFGTYLNIEFKIQDLRHTLLYFIKRWYLMLKDEELWSPKDGSDGIKQLLNKQFEKVKEEAKSISFIDEKEKYIHIYREMYNSITNGIINDSNNQELLQSTPNTLEEGNNYKNASTILMGIPILLLYSLSLPGSSILIGTYLAGKGLKSLYEVLRIEELLEAVSVLADIIEITVITEAKVGLAGGFNLEASEGAKARVSLGLEGGLIHILKLMDDSEFYTLKSSDPYNHIYDEIKGFLDENNYQPDSVRKALLGALPN